MKKGKTFKVVLWVAIGLMLISWFLPDAGWSYLLRLGLTLTVLFLLIFGFKEKNNTIKVVLITMLAFMLFSWILSAAYYSGQYVDQGRVQMGLFDLFNYPVTALSYFGYIAVYILAIGGFYGVLNKIPAYRSFLDRMADVCKGTEKFALVVLMLLIAVLTSISSLQLALLFLFPMLISWILLMGYDKTVAALVLVIPTMVGIAGTTYGYQNNYMLLSLTNIKITSEMLPKLIILVLGVALIILNVILYIKKSSGVKTVKKTVVKPVKAVKNETVKEEKTVKSKAPAKKAPVKKTTTKKTTVKKTTTKTTSKKNTRAAVKDEEVIVVLERVKEDNGSLIPASVNNARYKVWPFIVMFSVLFALLVLAFTSWSDGFGLDAFTNATKAVSETKLFGFEIFGKLLGNVNAFGAWTVVDYLAPMFVVILLLTIIYGVKFDDVIDGFFSGMKKALPLGVIVILLYTCLVIVTYHPFQLSIYKALLAGIKKVNFGSTILVTISGIFAGLFNVDAAYAYQSILPYLTGILDVNFNIFALAYQVSYGFAMMFAPTSLILMLVLAYLEIPYKKWFSAIWKFLLEFLALILIVFLVLVLI